MTAHGIAWRDDFLENLAVCRGNVRKAAGLTGVHPSTVYKRHGREESFSRRLRAVLDRFPHRRGVKTATS